MVKNILTGLLLLLVSVVAYGQRSVDIDESKVSFEVSNMKFNTVEGTFTGMKGTIEFDPTDLSNAKMNVCRDANSVDTDNKKRDEHLRKEDFFDVANYPAICFALTSAEKSTTGSTATGTLTMHGITKEVSIPFTFSDNTFRGTLSIDRMDYEVGASGGFMVGRTVEMESVCVVR